MPPVTETRRIAGAFDICKQEQRPALVAYLTAGCPSPDATAEIAFALERGGASILELGVPFSDPIADGPVIQRASARALQAGTNVARVLEISASIRRKSQIPIVLFSYMNPLLRYGFDRLCADAKQAGVDGCLFTDLSVEEADTTVSTMKQHGLDTVFLAAPTSTPRRLELVARHSTGFVYVVSRAGVTGEQVSVAGGVAELCGSLRGITSLPLAVGFGVSRREHVQSIAGYADGVVVGSAIMRVIEEHSDLASLPRKLETFTGELTGRA
jgi:tryptophan synthase alpha chain